MARDRSAGQGGHTILEEVTFMQRPKKQSSWSSSTWETKVADRMKSMYKDPEVSVSLVC